MVAGEGPDVAGDGGEVGHVAADEEAEHYGEEDGHPGGGHGLAEDVDYGVEGGVGEGVFDGGDVVGNGDYGGEDQDEVDEVHGDHGFGDGRGGVADFFGHVGGLDMLVYWEDEYRLRAYSVEAELGIDTRELTDKDGEARAEPTTIVREAGPDFLRCGGGCVDPYWDDESEVGEDVDGESDVLPEM